MKETGAWESMESSSPGSRIFLLLVVPVCGLIDGRIRRYVEFRRQRTKEPSIRTGVRLPNCDSITSWDVRDKQSRLEACEAASSPGAREIWST